MPERWARGSATLAARLWSVRAGCASRWHRCQYFGGAALKRPRRVPIAMAPMPESLARGSGASEPDASREATDAGKSCARLWSVGGAALERQRPVRLARAAMPMRRARGSEMFEPDVSREGGDADPEAARLVSVRAGCFACGRRCRKAGYPVRAGNRRPRSGAGSREERPAMRDDPGAAPWQGPSAQHLDLRRPVLLRREAGQAMSRL